jgi:hypothetical protein
MLSEDDLLSCIYVYCSKMEKNNHTATSATPKILINEAIEARNFLGRIHRQVEAIASHWRLCPNEETALFSRALRHNDRVGR